MLRPRIHRARVPALLLLLTALFTNATFGASQEPVRASHGMVSSSSAIASQVGVEIMQAGGNAVDAAVAVGFALAVTFPSAGNLGGGGFMVIFDPSTSKATAIDYREVAPAAAHRDMYLDENGDVVEGGPTNGHRAVAVPGTPAGLLYALDRYGTMTRKRVLAPAIKLARKGFTVNYHLAQSLERSSKRLGAYPESNRLFLRNGNHYREGETLRQPELAATLKRIAKSGREGFYSGRTAELLVAEMARGDGIITAEDLANYRPRERVPVRGSYRGNAIVSMPPPSSGGTILVEMLNMLEPLDVASLGLLSSSYVHNVVEVMKRAFADRAEYMGDPDFVEVPAAGLRSKAYARMRRAGIDSERTTPASELGSGDPWPFESEETTHFSVIDAGGMAVSNTFTLNYSYGSGVTVTGAGFLLNNIMDNFTSKIGVPNGYGLIQGEANAIAAGKRPLSSMTPTIVLSGDRVRLIAGTPGGPTIINTVLQIILDVVDHGLNPQQAVDLPRFHHQWLPDAIQYERGALVQDVNEALAAKGHELAERGLIGDAHVIEVDLDSGTRLGGADPRRGGAAVGY